MSTPRHESLTPRRDFLKTTATLVAAAAGTPLLHAAPPAAPTSPGLPPRSIFPYPQQLAWGSGTISFSRRAKLAVGSGCDAALIDLLQDTWRRFTCGAVELHVGREAALDPWQFALFAGDRPAAVKREGRATYALTVGAQGAAADAADAAGLRHAWFTLLQLLNAAQTSDGGLAFDVPAVEIQDWPALGFRGLHLCVFHETPPLMLEKAIRLAAFFKFTHVVLEFWGMLKLEALKELSWPEAWSKADAGRLVSIARGMGLDVVPMFNSWGHAAACREKHGRHVVLDQNPRLAPLFEPDGWTWCLTNPRAQALLRRIYDELIEFAGPGQYFHIGCDEAYSHATCDRCRATDRVQLLADHLNNLARYLDQRGRRPLMWGDALLERGQWPAGFAANGTPTLPSHRVLEQLSRKIIINDWHYSPTGEIPTLAHFRQAGFETIACPWNSAGNIRALSRAARANGSAGVLMTTWHHLVQSIPILHFVANCTWNENQVVSGLRQHEGSLPRLATAAILRKLVPADGQFDRAGWNSFEMPAEPD